MKPSEAIKRISYLRRELQGHNHRYYCLAEPCISDYEYDMLFKELELLEREWPLMVDDDSPTQTVGCNCEQAKQQAGA